MVEEGKNTDCCRGENIDCCRRGNTTVLLPMVKRKIDPKPPLVSADVREKDVKSICSTPVEFFSVSMYLEMIETQFL